MTSKKFLIIWALLIGAALGGFGLYTVALERVHHRAEGEAAAYIPVSDLEALKIFLEDCPTNIRVRKQLYIADATCESASAAPSSEVIKYAQESHERRHYDSEVWPRKIELTESLEQKFLAFNVGLAIVAAVAFFLWCKATLFPFIRRSKEKVAAYAHLPKALKDASTSRKARHAQEDFDTLKRLHESGLVSDEMFAERKEAIKGRLSESGS